MSGSDPIEHKDENEDLKKLQERYSWDFVRRKLLPEIFVDQCAVTGKIES